MGRAVKSNSFINYPKKGWSNTNSFFFLLGKIASTVIQFASIVAFLAIKLASVPKTTAAAAVTDPMAAVAGTDPMAEVVAVADLMAAVVATDPMEG
jgi:hypothetical protein